MKGKFSHSPSHSGKAKIYSLLKIGELRPLHFLHSYSAAQLKKEQYNDFGYKCGRNL